MASGSDVLDGYLFLDHVLQQVLGNFKVERHGGIDVDKGDDSAECPFDRAHVRTNVLCDEVEDVRRYLAIACLHLRFENGQARFVGRRFDFRDHALLETRNEPFFQLKFLWRHVAGHHHLLVVDQQLVDGIEKFFLELLLSDDELNVVQQQQIILAVACPEGRQSSRGDGVDIFVEECFGRDVADGSFGIVVQYVMANGFHEMRLAKSRSAPDEKRIVGGSSQSLRHGCCGGVRKGI